MDKMPPTHPVRRRPMSLRYLLGPLHPNRAAAFDAPRREGRCLTFGAADCDIALRPEETWTDLLLRLPSGWVPDLIVLDLNYSTVPACLWEASLPLVALAPDWQLHWHFLRLALPLCSLVLTDSPGVEVMRREGIHHARQARFFGLQGIFAEPAPEGLPPRDIDILFVGNMQRSVQRERLSWLARVARLAPKWRVKILQGVHGEAYRDLLRRSRIVFNRSVRGEWNLRVCEAGAQGALLFQEAGNHEMRGEWTHGVDCIYYDEKNLESLLEHYLSHEGERAAIAQAGKQKALAYTLESDWHRAEGLIESHWP